MIFLCMSFVISGVWLLVLKGSSGRVQLCHLVWDFYKYSKVARKIDEKWKLINCGRLVRLLSLGLHLCTLFLLAWDPYLGSVLAWAVITMQCCVLFLAKPKLAWLTWPSSSADLVTEDLEINRHWSHLCHFSQPSLALLVGHHGALPFSELLLLTFVFPCL